MSGTQILGRAIKMNYASQRNRTQQDNSNMNRYGGPGMGNNPGQQGHSHGQMGGYGGPMGGMGGGYHPHNPHQQHPHYGMMGGGV